MSNVIKTIDLVSDFQKRSVAQINEAVFKEKNVAGETIFEILIWWYYFDWILFSYPDYESLPKESILYKYCWSSLYGKETWGDYTEGEVEVDRLEEFYVHLKSITLRDELNVEKEFAAILEICESAIKHKNKLFFIADYL